MGSSMTNDLELKEAIQALEAKDEARKSEMDELKKQMTEVKKENQDLKFKVSQLYGRLEAKADKKKTAFFVKWKSSNPLSTGSIMHLENYKETGLVNPCKFLDSRTGIYTSVLEGKYRIMVLKSVKDLDVYLCTDDGRKKLQDFKDLSDTSFSKLGKFGYLDIVKLEINTKVWLEIVPRVADTEIEILFEGCEEVGYRDLEYNVIPDNDDDENDNGD